MSSIQDNSCAKSTEKKGEKVEILDSNDLEDDWEEKLALKVNHNSGYNWKESTEEMKNHEDETSKEENSEETDDLTQEEETERTKKLPKRILAYSTKENLKLFELAEK